MDTITEQSTTPVKEHALLRITGVLKKTAAVLACICIYSSSAYAQEGSFVSTIGPITNIRLISPTDGQVFEIEPPAPTAPVSPVQVTGTWEYTWLNSTGTAQPINLYAAIVVKDSEGSNVVNIFQAIDTVLVPSNPHDIPSNAHHGSRSFNATVELGSLELGSYTASVAIQGAAGMVQTASIQVVPEPETYAMFIAGLGLLGWRLRRLKK